MGFCVSRSLASWDTLGLRFKGFRSWVGEEEGVWAAVHTLVP